MIQPSMKKFKKKIENLKNQKDLYIHLRRRILTIANLLGYEKLFKVQKDMGFQKRILEKERGPDPIPVM